MKSYRDLEVYKESKHLAIEIHKLSLTLPKFELYEEGGQTCPMAGGFAVHQNL